MYCNCSFNYHFVSAVLIGIQIAMGEISPIFFKMILWDAKSINKIMKSIWITNFQFSQISIVFNQSVMSTLWDPMNCSPPSSSVHGELE